MCVADDAFTVRLEAQKQLKQERQQEIKDRLKASKDAAEETRRGGAVRKTAVKIMDEEIGKLLRRAIRIKKKEFYIRILRTGQ